MVNRTVIEIRMVSNACDIGIQGGPQMEMVFGDNGRNLGNDCVRTAHRAFQKLVAAISDSLVVFGG